MKKVHTIQSDMVLNEFDVFDLNVISYFDIYSKPPKLI